jgi:site-specific DNA-methyltransferase (adenine-specific)
LEWESIFQNITLVKDNKTNGLIANVLTVESLFSVLNLKLNDILTHSAKENVTLKENEKTFVPNSEPIVLARKPLDKGLSIAENVLKWGVGAINIDGCRVGSEVRTMPFNLNSNIQHHREETSQGRFPANLILSCSCENENEHNDNCPIKILDEQSGESKSRIGKERGTEKKGLFANSTFNKVGTEHNDEGGASRFFYVAKASKSERNKGLEGFEEKEKPDNYIMPKLTCSECGSKRVDSSNTLVCGCNGKTHYEQQNSIESKNNLAGGNKNIHPTVKPIKLMQYLVRLVTPPRGIVLDPFCGSGTTGVACKLENFQFVGLEQDAEYCNIAKARIDNFVEEKETKKEKKNIKPIQNSLFDA